MQESFFKTHTKKLLHESKILASQRNIQQRKRREATSDLNIFNHR